MAVPDVARGGRMTRRAVMAAVLALAVLSSALPAPARAADVPPPRLYYTLLATEVNARPSFVGPDATNPNYIVVQVVPAILNITVRAVAGAMHTFTIRGSDGTTPLVNLDLRNNGDVGSVEFTLAAAGQISVNGGANRTVETDAGRLKFVCVPHAAAGMVGYIVVGGVQQPTTSEEKGVFLRAYWIGLLGIAGTLLLVGLSYFVIKSSSRHFRDHHEHIRRGGP